MDDKEDLELCVKVNLRKTNDKIVVVYHHYLSLISSPSYSLSIHISEPGK